jgi:Fic family protein
MLTNALAELKGVCETIPNPSILIRSIGLQEAKTSSEIENILTTNDDLYQSLDSIDAADPATKEALRYQDALMVGVKEIKNKPILSTKLFCKL